MKNFKTYLEEGRPSQRHPLEGHEYHKKSDEALIHIAKDAHAAAEAMKGHNTQAENKYRDQANDSATVRHFRKTHGMPDWYKKKYGHVKEEVKVGDKIHLGLTQKGGSGMRGTVHKVEGDKVHVNLGKEKYGDRIVKGMMKNVTKEEVEIDESLADDVAAIARKRFGDRVRGPITAAEKKKQTNKRE